MALVSSMLLELLQMPKEEYVPSTIKLSIPSLTYTQNEEELQLASYSELMRLLYVAMTRAEKNSI